ncbi:ABHD16A [Bugula neritina]|uniref:ABHD16A n=1 Tax=Bugula neritina TaxID=10212 RepID=A0A7J7J8K8_BUGNE|nr:ABHD16A [Bugula neritina]
MAFVWMFTSGPQLFYRYKDGSHASTVYAENKAEAYSSRIINCLRASWSVCYFFSPLLLIMFYRRGIFHSADGLSYYAKIVAATVAVYYAAHLTRGFGRMSNSAYKVFAEELNKVKTGRLPPSALAKYDFQFSHWPVNYSLKNNRSRPVSVNQQSDTQQLSFSQKVKLVPLQVLSYLAAHSFARWMIYPGSTDLLNAMIGPNLLLGRKKLVESYSGKRYKLETYEGNHIDSIFIDRRHHDRENGNTLVIVSEGNAAFYEAGCMDAPLQKGYSILGWNHPGFGSSTGKPHPEQEHNAIDTVVQFALNKLNFPVDQIIFFSWSIGGFASSWAAANYPECKALILDATFDDILPLAANRMPVWMAGLVDIAVRKYFNLDIASWVNKYDGPVKLIRRTQDEMISTNPANVATNRGNFLLIKILERRYPKILNNESIAVVTQYLSFTENMKQVFLSDKDIDFDVCHITLLDLARQNDMAIPMLGGDDLDQSVKDHLALYLATKYMEDMTSTHCVPLPAEMFKLPWQLT